jgi:hypothetical protein
MTGPDPQLAELADLAMDLARDAARRAKAAADPQAVQLIAAFERLARSVRLGKLLQQRLQQTQARARREDRERLLERRSQQVKAALTLEIDEQAGLAQAVRLHRQLCERLEHERLSEALALGPVEAHVARLRKLLGLPEPAAEACSADPPSTQAAQLAPAPSPEPAAPAQCGSNPPPPPQPP